MIVMDTLLFIYLLTCIAFDTSHPSQIENGGHVHGVDGGDDEHVHNIVGVQVHVHHAWEPFLGDVQGSYYRSYHRHKILSQEKNWALFEFF